MCQARPEQTKPGQTRPDQARPDQARLGSVCLAGHSISPTVRQAVGQPVGQLDNQRVQPQDSWTIGQTAKHLVPHETFEKHTQQAQDMDTLWLSSTRKGAAAAGG